MSAELPRHRAHDFHALIAAWHRVAKAAGLRPIMLGEVEGHPVVVFETQASVRGVPAVYISTGVHGDEAAAPWGLLQWAEAHLDQLREEAFVLCPCLNPVGLMMNTRADYRGVDINRRFHLKREPLMAAWQKLVRERTLRLGLCLHEDYDAQGCYIYELGAQSRPLSPHIMAATAAVIGPDPRSNIDGRRARKGIIRRKILPPDIEGPEAIVLHQLGCPITLTFETPSEFALDIRVHAQRTCIEATLERLPVHRP
jgi:hypothetical protein